MKTRYFICRWQIFFVLFTTIMLLSCEKNNDEEYPQVKSKIKNEHELSNRWANNQNSLIVDELILPNSTKTLYSEFLPPQTEMIFKNTGISDLEICLSSSINIPCMISNFTIPSGAVKVITWKDLGGSYHTKHINATNSDLLKEGHIVLKIEKPDPVNPLDFINPLVVFNDNSDQKPRHVADIIGIIVGVVMTGNAGAAILFGIGSSALVG